MSCLPRSPQTLRLIIVVVATLNWAGCNQRTNKLNDGAGDSKLQPTGGARAAENAGDAAEAGSGTARLADEDMVADAPEQQVAIADNRTQTHYEPPAQAQPKPEASAVPPKTTAKPAPPPVADSDAPPSKPKAKPSKPAAKGQKTYVVRQGDSLWKIAQKQYGDGRAWRRIYNANRAKIADPADVPIGTKLVIP